MSFGYQFYSTFLSQSVSCSHKWINDFMAKNFMFHKSTVNTAFCDVFPNFFLTKTTQIKRIVSKFYGIKQLKFFCNAVNALIAPQIAWFKCFPRQNILETWYMITVIHASTVSQVCDRIWNNWGECNPSF